MKFTQIAHLPPELQERARQILRAKGALPLHDPPVERDTLWCGHTRDATRYECGGHPHQEHCPVDCDRPHHTPQCVELCARCEEEP